MVEVEGSSPFTRSKQSSSHLGEVFALVYVKALLSQQFIKCLFGKNLHAELASLF